ncbi:MAG TPA: hypothetical protein VGX51_14310 [Solirubrobacteraceae bacterium]|jgi:hypothetical protein|nr:hypothetical protein [Solirubrobacteraceae bacterium]
MPRDGVVKVEVSSPVVRDALLDGCAGLIQFENEHREQSTQRTNGFDPVQCAQRIVLATTLDEQLVAGYPVVDVPVEIADPVARTLVELIAEEVDSLASDKQRRDAILARTNELLESLVALDAGIVTDREPPS